MTSEKLLKSLSLKSKKFLKKYKDLIDIVIYGSLVKGKDKADIDIALIFLKTSLKERSEISQQFKSEISLENTDVKCMNLEDFFNEHFLARQGILLEGISLYDKRSLAGKLGFKSSALFSYTLKGLSHNEKIKFNYALRGRTNKGVLKELEGRSLAPSVMIIPIKNKIIFEDFLNRWNIKFKVNDVLMPIF